MDIDLKIGDIVLGGRFKNHRMEAKKFGTDDLGQPTINGRKLLTVRLEKLMPVKQQSRKTREEAMNKQALLNQIHEDAFNDELEKVASNPVLQAITKHEEGYKDIKDKYHKEFGRRNRSALSGAVVGALAALAGKSRPSRFSLGALGASLGALGGAGIATAYSRKKNPAYGAAFDKHQDEASDLEEKGMAEKERLTGEYKSLGRQLRTFRGHGF